MTEIISPLQKAKEWQNLLSHAESMKNIRLRNLFENDLERLKKFSCEKCNILLDYSKNRISSETLSLLSDLANFTGLEQKKKQLFSGNFSNVTEQRMVSHVQQRDINHSIQQKTFKQIEVFTEQVRSGYFCGYSGKPIRFVVNIGIGGSHLGLEMVIDALKKNTDSIQAFFVSNVDTYNLYQILEKINLEETLFIIASKSFLTQETLTNAQTAKKIVLKHFNGNIKSIEQHFCATSNQTELTTAFGIKRTFSIEKEIGGRYSLWSSIGLPIALTLGFSEFKKLHQGGYEMDQNFKNAPIHQNIPTLLALIGIWNVNFLNFTTQVIIPYSEQLKRFPSFLQQLEMESNGKSIDKNGMPISYQTCPILWGECGTNAQHSFFQLLHQGTHVCPADFLFVINPTQKNQEHHHILASHFLAQTQALMKGKNLQEVRLENNGSSSNENYKIFEGNKPTNSLILSHLDAKNLGSLIVAYEHKVFVQGVIWNIHSFDQWGVEYGKQLAKGVLNKIKQPSLLKENALDDLIRYYQKKTT